MFSWQIDTVEEWIARILICLVVVVVLSLALSELLADRDG